MTTVVNARIQTDVAAPDVLDALATHFARMNATSLERNETSLRVKNPEDGSLVDSQADTTVTISLTQTDDGWLVTGTIDQKTKLIGISASVGGIIISIIAGYGILFLISLISTIFTLVQISNQSNAIKRVVTECFDLVKNELSNPQGEVLRKCPYCAELVRREAIKCKHCGSEIAPLAVSVSPRTSDTTLAIASQTPSVATRSNGVPMGECPVCNLEIPIDSSDCPRCMAPQLELQTPTAIFKSAIEAEKELKKAASNRFTFGDKALIVTLFIVGYLSIVVFLLLDVAWWLSLIFVALGLLYNSKKLAQYKQQIVAEGALASEQK